MKTIVVVAAVVALTMGCGVDSSEPEDGNSVVGSFICTDQLVAGITVAVRDAATGAAAACGAQGTLAETGYVESMSDDGRCSRDDVWLYLSGAWERAGSYRVTITKPGYQAWVQEGVTVTFDGCHVRPVALQANLVP